MNCKPGDLAVVTSSVSGRNVGRVLTVIRLASPEEVKAEMPKAARLGAIWRTDTPMTWIKWDGELRDVYLAPDFRLRPIRDNDGDDETLTWAGRPEQLSRPVTA